MTKVELFNKFLEDSDATVTISFLFCKENYGLFFKRRDLACILSLWHFQILIHKGDLLKLLTEKYKVKKPPFHPKKHETFYYVTVLGDIEKEDFYEEYTFHYLLCNLGKCYKTYEEAEKHVEEDIKSYKNMQNRIERS